MAGRSTRWLRVDWSGRSGGEGLPPEKAAVIYMDPPWGWLQWNGQQKVPHRSADAPYDSMTFEELKALPVADLAKPHALLFMWVVSSHIGHGMELAEGWGFTHRALGFVWVKTDKRGRPKMSLGRWTRQESEICLIFGRGRPPRLSGGVRQVLMERPTEHSRKPDEFAHRIRELVGGPYLEMFARRPRFHWTVWGDQVPALADAASTHHDAQDSPGRLVDVETGVCGAER